VVAQAAEMKARVLVDQDYSSLAGHWVEASRRDSYVLNEAMDRVGSSAPVSVVAVVGRG
jgi:hypothetical protein